MRVLTNRTTRRFVLLGSSLVIATAFTGCGGSDDDNSGSTPQPTATRATTTNTPTPHTVGATATPTASHAPNQPTATATRTPAVNQGNLSKVQAVINSVLPSVLSLRSFGALAGAPASTSRYAPQIAVPCPAGGTLSFDCSPSGSGSRTQINFSTCKVGAPGVASTTINGTFAETTAAGCFSPVPAGSPLGIEFHGSINTTNPATGQPLSVTFDLSMQVSVATNGTVTFDFNGSVDDACAGHVEIDTLESLVIPSGAACPTAGRLRITVSSGSSEVVYSGSGGISIDVGADGSVDQSYANCSNVPAGSCN